MKIDLEMIKFLELKLAECGKENATIAEHGSSTLNGGCIGSFIGNCFDGCWRWLYG